MNNIQAVNTSIANAEAFNRWIGFIDGTPKTVETYTRAVRQYANYLRDHEIIEPTKLDVMAFRDSLTESGHKATTVTSYLMAVKQFYKWLEEEGGTNIAKNVKAPKINKGHKKDYLTSAQVKKLLGTIDRRTAQGRRDYAIILLILTTGMRSIEVIRANIGDMQPKADFMALYFQGKGYADKETTYKVIPHQVYEAITETLADRENTTDEEPLFISCSNRNKDGRLTTKSLSRIVAERMKIAGIKTDRLTEHSLRHTAATTNLLNGGTLEETQQLLGHTNINTTMVYVHTLDKAQSNSEQRLADVFLSA